jgi:hypothetical protein
MNELYVQLFNVLSEIQQKKCGGGCRYCSFYQGDDGDFDSSVCYIWSVSRDALYELITD